MFESASALGIDWIGRDRIGPILDLLEAGPCADLRNRSDAHGRTVGRKLLTGIRYSAPRGSASAKIDRPKTCENFSSVLSQGVEGIEGVCFNPRQMRHARRPAPPR
jgi:hypothetical protein